MPESGNRLVGYPSLLSMQTGTTALGGNKPLSANKGSKAKGDTLRSVMPLSNRQSALSCSRLGLSFRVDLPDIVTSANFGLSRVGFLGSFRVEMAKNVRPGLHEFATPDPLIDIFGDPNPKQTEEVTRLPISSG